MRRIIAATFMLASLTGGVFAQAAKEDDPAVGEQKQKLRNAEEIDKKYKSTLERTRKDTAVTRADPWSNMRGADDSKTKR
ncbi:MAG: hypothetical protein HY244_16660 [Rhizobiales bacterium]|nr:hypothetical protein [Hyphomicrobiales bacterium]